MVAPVEALLQHAIEYDIYLRYLDDPKEYQANRSAEATFHDRLLAMLDEPAKQLLDDFLGEKDLADIAAEEALFTAGLAFGLQLLKLL